MNAFTAIFRVTLLSAFRDRVVHALLGAAALLFLLIPLLSLFSMRQVQELAITLSLSSISFILFVYALLLGSVSIWRDIERRHTAGVLGLPIPRGQYVLGKFFGVAGFLALALFILGISAAIVIAVSAAQYPSQLPILWTNVLAALFLDGCKHIMVLALALLLSTLSTSFFLPIFGTLAIYCAGSASQEVMEYLGTEASEKLPAIVRLGAKVFYYVVPNFAALDLKVQAIYALPLSGQGILLSLLYFLVYTAILLTLAVIAFRRRELP